jgi:haloalkane dehalogenase
MKALRTPDARFEGLVDYRFAANYLTVADSEGGCLRVHYLDEGKHGAGMDCGEHMSQCFKA